ncbi:hypothetical protein TEA_013509 [Camellia sinensis var. sinensis]|uniref:Queuosine 5'-phosphate N-glycosylase/hydrolase n=1 Tax=Camellia sinensis var. sinensis TaxID=542762 RepID=A0A4S4D0V2_CAMSN|nr:hypothetical protein TEA_013509 [Camellia sinensis var. sinensis]
MNLAFLHGQIFPFETAPIGSTFFAGSELRKWLILPRPLPLEDERVRLLHENFEGKASNLVESCGKSAVKLVALVTSHFPGIFNFCIAGSNYTCFRDHTVYKGHQIFLSKRAQIFASDLRGSFKGKGYGEFNDIGAITIFADYIVSAVLRQLGVLRYNSSLAGIIEAKCEIGFRQRGGSGTTSLLDICCRENEGVNLEKIWKTEIAKSKALWLYPHALTLTRVLSVDLDLWLWSIGVECPSLQHHWILSIY